MPTLILITLPCLAVITVVAEGTKEAEPGSSAPSAPMPKRKNSTVSESTSRRISDISEEETGERL